VSPPARSPAASAPDLAAPYAQQLLERGYRAERTLGEGGMGTVVAARELHSDQLVAIKLVRADRASDPVAIARFLREARNMQRLLGPHVARVLNTGRLASGLPYFVMEHLDGMTMATRLREQGRLPVATAVDYLIQVCEAVAEAHRAGIVHRDLKPSNLFLVRASDGSEMVKVIDFGVSKWASGLAGDADGGDARLTTTATAVGSPAYMSPEQLRAGSTVDARADIWALGVILYELMTGTHPFAAPSIADLHVRILRDPAPPLSSGAPDAPDALDAIYRHCVAKDPAARMPTIADLALALAPFGSAAARRQASAILAPAIDAATTVDHEARPALPRRAKRPWRLFAGAAVAALCAGLAVVVSATVFRAGGARVVGAPAPTTAANTASVVPHAAPAPALAAPAPAPMEPPPQASARGTRRTRGATAGVKRGAVPAGGVVSDGHAGPRPAPLDAQKLFSTRR
jgi:serine/threonine-protein kinase